MGNLTAEMIGQHPALAAFQQYIQEHSHRTPHPGEIEFSNTNPNDGVIELFYSRGRDVYVAQIDANNQLALHLRRGTQRGNAVQWAGPIEDRPTADACRTVQALGGEEERNFHCPTTPIGDVPPDLFRQRATWLGQWSASNLAAVELVNGVRRWRGATSWNAQSPTMSALRNSRAWATPVGSNELSFTQRLAGYGPVLGAGAVTMFSANHVSDMIGLHSDYHANERYAFGAYASYGSMSGMTWLLNRNRPASARLAAPSLAAGLVSSALVDATLGQMWQEGSGERQAVRMGAFFLPQVYRMAFGSRSIALAETRAASGMSRWGGRAVSAAFYADAAYMIYDHLAHSNRETARSNMIYRRASQLHDANAHPLRWAFNGAVEMVAPSLAQRLLTPDSYVAQAQEEMNAASTDSARRLRGYLSHALLMGPTGPATDASFYTELNWDWLRGNERLGTLRRSDGHELPLDLIAEHLQVPAIHQHVFEELDQAQRVAYLQREFRGYDLSPADVEESLARIALHSARQEIRDLYLSAGGDAAALTHCFDENGSLLAGRESDLLAQVFPGESVNPEQVLALRRVALARRILELRQNDPAGELAALDRVGREIGLIDAGGNLVGEASQFALASLESHPPAPVTAPPVRPVIPSSSVIQGIMAYGAQHG